MLGVFEKYRNKYGPPRTESGLLDYNPELTSDIYQLASMGKYGNRVTTPFNPLMNVNVTEFGNPHYLGGPGSSGDAVKKMMDRGLVRDADSILYERINSQRQFYTMPVNTVPNEQTQFAHWLYGTDRVCKAGSIWSGYGLPYTEDSLVCNGFNTTTMTNGGLLNEQVENTEKNF